MGSMKRIDVLKGIEQILVQKAYETGHISHRADGDWQKQADGSWKPYKGQSSQSAPQTQEPTENTEHGEITEEDLKKLDKKELSQHLSNMHNQTIQSLLNDLENGKITEDQFKNQMSDLNNNITTSLNSLNDDEEDLKGSNTTDTSNIDTKEKKRDVQNKIGRIFNLRDEDTKKMLGIRRDDDNEHGYDGEVRFYADGNRNIKPASDRKEFDKVVQHYLDKAGLEDTPFNHKVAHKYIVGYAKNNGLIGDYYWSKVLYPNGYESDDENVEKSAVRDMRSTPTVKNMGF